MPWPARIRYTNFDIASFVNLASDSSDAANTVPISGVRVGVAYKFGGGFGAKE
jgi:hypothetical protein